MAAPTPTSTSACFATPTSPHAQDSVAASTPPGVLRRRGTTSADFKLAAAGFNGGMDMGMLCLESIRHNARVVCDYTRMIRACQCSYTHCVCIGPAWPCAYVIIAIVTGRILGS